MPEVITMKLAQSEAELVSVALQYYQQKMDQMSFRVWSDTYRLRSEMIDPILMELEAQLSGGNHV
jgi:hypothetical protein